MPYLAIVILLVLVSCQSPPRASDFSDSVDDSRMAAVADPPLELKNIIRNWNQAKKAELARPIAQLLTKAKILRAGQKSEVLDLLCQISAEKEEVVSRCTFLLKTAKKWIPRSIKGELAEELRLELSRYPVPQGDSGVSVSYLRCQSSATEPACELAIDLGYEGP
jgi:hypothetical protein